MGARPEELDGGAEAVAPAGPHSIRCSVAAACWRPRGSPCRKRCHQATTNRQSYTVRSVHINVAVSVVIDHSVKKGRGGSAPHHRDRR
jgi:hypothetical protein